MLEGFKFWLRVYSIVILSILTIRKFIKTGKSFESQLKAGLKTGSLIPIVIYLINI